MSLNKGLKMKSIVCALGVVLVTAMALPVRAAPVTWEFAGTTANVFTSGDYATRGFANRQSFTLTIAWEHVTLPTSCTTVTCIWYTGTTRTVSVNGYTFTLADIPDPLPSGTTFVAGDTSSADLFSSSPYAGIAGPAKQITDGFRSDGLGPWLGSTLPFTSGIQTGFSRSV